MNRSGLCDLHEGRKSNRPPRVDAIEQYCNAIAGAILMPADLMKADPTVQQGRGSDWPLEVLRLLSRRFGASSESILLRLVDLEFASWEVYWDRKAELDVIYEQVRREKKAKAAESEGGPSYYVVKARDLGHGYISSVLEAYRAKAISSLDVSDYLDVKYEQLPKLAEVLR